jgi:hypothetical protein
MEHLDTLLEADKDASDTFKNGFNGREIMLIPAFSIRMSLASSKVLWSVFNSLMFLDTSAISSSSAIVSPLNLSAPEWQTNQRKKIGYRRIFERNNLR